MKIDVMTENTLTLLLVTTAGQTYGIPYWQVKQLTKMPASDLSSPVAVNGQVREWCELATNLGFPPNKVAYILWTESGIGWAVEAIGDLKPILLTDLQRLPPLLNQRTSCAVWGAVIEKEKVILLLDLERLAVPMSGVA